MIWRSRAQMVMNMALPTKPYSLVLALLLGLLLGGGLRILFPPLNYSTPVIMNDLKSWRQGQIEHSGSEKRFVKSWTGFMKKDDSNGM